MIKKLLTTLLGLVLVFGSLSILLRVSVFLFYFVKSHMVWVGVAAAGIIGTVALVGILLEAHGAGQDFLDALKFLRDRFRGEK